MPRDLGPRDIIFVATRQLRSRTVNLEPGDPFPIQQKWAIRDLGPSFGVAEAARWPFSRLDYVRVNAPTRAARRPAGTNPARTRRMCRCGRAARGPRPAPAARGPVASVSSGCSA